MRCWDAVDTLGLGWNIKIEAGILGWCWHIGMGVEILGWGWDIGMAVSEDKVLQFYRGHRGEEGNICSYSEYVLLSSHASSHSHMILQRKGHYPIV